MRCVLYGPDGTLEYTLVRLFKLGMLVGMELDGTLLVLVTVGVSLGQGGNSA